MGKHKQDQKYMPAVASRKILKKGLGIFKTLRLFYGVLYVVIVHLLIQPSEKLYYSIGIFGQRWKQGRIRGGKGQRDFVLLHNSKPRIFVPQSQLGKNSSTMSQPSKFMPPAPFPTVSKSSKDWTTVRSFSLDCFSLTIDISLCPCSATIARLGRAVFLGLF